MKTLLAAALLLATAFGAQAASADKIADGMCSSEKNAERCATKLSACVDATFEQMSAKDDEYSVTMATYYHCAEKQKLRIRVTGTEPAALGMIR